MKFLVGLVIGAFFLLVFNLRRIWAFLDLDPETCSFNTANMLPEYRDPGTLQFFGKILENTGYTWRRSGQAMAIENELIQAQGQKTFDTARNYDGSYIMVLYMAGLNELPFPHTINPIGYVRPHFMQLTTSYAPVQDVLLFNTTATEIRALSTGGFSIKNALVADSYALRLTGMIIELRKVAGV